MAGLLTCSGLSGLPVMNSGTGCLNVVVTTSYSLVGDLAFILRLTTRDLLLKELTAAGTVQDLHLFPFRIAPEWNNFTKMRVKDKQIVGVEKEKFLLFIALKSKTNLQI